MSNLPSDNKNNVPSYIQSNYNAAMKHHFADNAGIIGIAPEEKSDFENAVLEHLAKLEEAPQEDRDSIYESINKLDVPYRWQIKNAVKYIDHQMHANGQSLHWQREHPEEAQSLTAG